MAQPIKNILPWILRGLAALILLQTLFYKFSAAEESVYIFSTLGMEPWGRIGTGVAELIASVLLLIPATTAVGAVMGIGLMGGAIFFHATRLGISVRGDGGQLFLYALLVFISCAGLLVLYRGQLIQIFNKNKTTLL
ncbi:MAG TPA: DoxX family protein [Puia sp.]|uniref:DoxX family protein n=1 Tax=Puia sp. TaxID=2045100 RepID=UPI002CEFE257|nr:DoxX family protein [Puia sp.]HVU94451.1 DoxX family protein [Puia sp.]